MFKLSSSYYVFEKEFYSLDEIVKEVNQTNCQNYSVYLDNIRTVSPLENIAIQKTSFKSIPKRKAISKTLFYFDASEFFFRTDTNREVIFDFFEINGDLFCNVTFFESKYEMFSSFFKVNGSDLKFLNESQTDKTLPSIFKAYQNPFYGIANWYIYLLGIGLIIAFEVATHKVIVSKEKQKVAQKK